MLQYFFQKNTSHLGRERYNRMLRMILMRKVMHMTCGRTAVAIVRGKDVGVIHSVVRVAAIGCRLGVIRRTVAYRIEKDRRSDRARVRYTQKHQWQ